MANDVDLDRLIADGVNSFTAIKESIQSFLEKLKITTNSSSSDLTLTPRNRSNRQSKQNNELHPKSDSKEIIVPWCSSSSSSEEEDLTSFDNYLEKLVDRVVLTPESYDSWPSEDFHGHQSNETYKDKGTSSLNNHSTIRRGSTPPLIFIHNNICVDKRPEKYRTSDVLMGRGQLKLAIYLNCGLLTVHVKKAKKLQSKISCLCNSYIKIEVIPCNNNNNTNRHCYCRTIVIRETNFPHFDQKFSFEIFSGDETRRIFISVWNQDLRCSEFLGCMSFGIGHLTEFEVCGWFRLLTDKHGKSKHFAVQSGTLKSIFRKGRRITSPFKSTCDHHQHRQQCVQRHVDRDIPRRVRDKRGIIQAQIEHYRQLDMVLPERTSSKDSRRHPGSMSSSSSTAKLPQQQQQLMPSSSSSTTNRHRHYNKPRESYEDYMNTSIEEDYPELSISLEDILSSRRDHIPFADDDVIII